MKKIAVVFTLALAVPVAAAQDKDLVDVSMLIETSVGNTLEILKDKSKTTEVKKVEVMKVMDPIFDFDLIAKLVLGRNHWPSFNKAQRREFTGLFVKQMRDSYFEKIDLLTDEAIEFDKPVRKKNKVHLKTTIVSKDQRYEMIYKLYKKKARWRVYDVELEGISIVKSYGAQYDQFLRENSPKELLAKMRDKALGQPDDIKAKRKRIKAGKSKAKKNG